MEHSQKKSRKEEKPKYESPVVISLGEVAKGAGGGVACSNGSAPAGKCTLGSTK